MGNLNQVVKRSLLSAALVIGAGMTQQAFACSCAQPRSIEEELDSATAVFSGKVTAVTKDTKLVRASFAVTKFFKGSTFLQKVAVSTFNNSGMCGFGFQKGGEYLVYAYLTEDGSIQTNICTRSATLASAKAEVEVLQTLVP